MRKISLLLLAGVAMLFGCGKDSNKTPAAPVKAALIFPDNNAACTTGTVISDTEDVIAFSWNQAANTTGYELHVKNLITNIENSYTSSQPGIPLHLLRNTPYAWYVVSKSSAAGTTAQSDTWKFYNSGPGIISHPPFPADNLTPNFGALVTVPSSGIVQLGWSGSDADNDIVGYDVYFGTTATPPLLQADVTAKSIDIANVAGRTTYYWRITTKDSK